MTSRENVNIARMESTFLQLTMHARTSALINAYHNEPVMWDVGRIPSEKEKALA